VWVWEGEGGGEGDLSDCEFEYDCTAVLSGHTQDVKYVKWHPNMKHSLFSASYDDTIRCW
jgi:WD40 repeat protein